MTVSGFFLVIAWLVVSGALNVVMFNKLFPQVERYRRHSNLLFAVLYEASHTLTMGLLLAVFALLQADPDGLLVFVVYYWLGIGVVSLSLLLVASKFEWGMKDKI